MRLWLDPPGVALEPGRYTALVAPPEPLLALLARPELDRFMALYLYGVSSRVLHRLPRRPPAALALQSCMTVHQVLAALRGAHQTIVILEYDPELLLGARGRTAGGRLGRRPGPPRASRPRRWSSSTPGRPTAASGRSPVRPTRRSTSTARSRRRGPRPRARLPAGPGRPSARSPRAGGADHVDPRHLGRAGPGRALGSGRRGRTGALPALVPRHPHRPRPPLGARRGARRRVRRGAGHGPDHPRRAPGLARRRRQGRGRRGPPADGLRGAVLQRRRPPGPALPRRAPPPALHGAGRRAVLD